MRCFYHGEAEAVALCKSCSRALCHDCAADVGNGSACRNRCEPEVEAINELLQRGRTAYLKTSGVYTRTGFFTCLLGLVLVGLGWLDRGEPNYSLMVMGLVFLFWGLSSFFSAYRFRQK